MTYVTLTQIKRPMKPLVLGSPRSFEDWATVGRGRRGGRYVCKQREKRKSKRLGLRVGTLDVGTMTGTDRELVVLMFRRPGGKVAKMEAEEQGSNCFIMV